MHKKMAPEVVARRLYNWGAGFQPATQRLRARLDGCTPTRASFHADFLILIL